MANRYWVGGTDTWNATAGTKWSDTSGGAGGSSVPGASDDVFFDASSGNVTCTLSTTTTVASLNFTGFTGTIAINAGLTINGNFTLSSSMTITGSSGVTIGNSATLTSNSKQLNLPLTFATIVTARTWTLVGDWYVTNAVLGNSNTATNILNGDKLYVSGNLSLIGTGPIISGTSEIVLIGTGTWSQTAGGYYNNITIDTSGTITLSGQIFFANKTLKHLNGTVSSTGATLRVGGSTTVLDLSLITVDKVQTSGNTQVTLNSNLNANTFEVSGSTINTYNGNSINVYGSLSVTSTGGITGNSTISLNGATWSSSGTGIIYNNLTFTSGTINVTGTVRYRSGTLTYAGGTVITTGSTLNALYGATLDTNGMSWDNISFVGGNPSTFTFNSDLYVNNLTITANYGAVYLNGNKIYINGNLTITIPSGATLGNTEIVLAGTGVWSHTTTSTIRNNLTIDSTGTVSVSGNVYYRTGTLTYVSGTVITTGSTLYSDSSTTFNTSGMTWSNVNMLSATAMTVTLSSNFNLSGSLYTYAVLTINGPGQVYTTGLNLAYYYIRGNSTINIIGGTLSTVTSANSGLQINTNLQGNVTITDVNFGGVAGITLTHTSGTITHTGTLIMTGSTLRYVDTQFVNWNNVTFPGGYAPTMVLQSDLNVYGLLSIVYIPQIGGSYNINCYGGLQMPSTTGWITLIYSGSPKFYLKGGTWSGIGGLGVPIFLDGNVTISGVVRPYATTLTWVSGTITASNSTLNLDTNNTLNTSGSNSIFGNVLLGSNTQTLTSDFNCSGLITMPSGSTRLPIINGSSRTMTTSGGIQIPASTTGYSSGTAKLKVTGGTISGTSSSTFQIRNNLDLDGNISIYPTNLYYGTGTITYLSGVVSASGSTLILSSSTLNTNGVTWGNVLTESDVTLTINSTFSIGGNFTNASTTTLTGSDVVVYGNLTQTSNTLGGSSKLIIAGNSTINCAGVAQIGTLSPSSQLEINSTGTVTFASNFRWQGSLLRYVSGDVNTDSSELQIIASTTMDTIGMTWSRVYLNATTLTLSSRINVDGTMSFNSTSYNSVTFAGSSGWRVRNFTYTNPSPTVTRNILLQQGVTYSIYGTGSILGTSSAPVQFRSVQTSGTKPKFIFEPTSTQNFLYVNPYRIDSSDGETVFSQFGVIDAETLNWINVSLSESNFLLLF